VCTSTAGWHSHLHPQPTRGVQGEESRRLGHCRGWENEPGAATPPLSIQRRYMKEVSGRQGTWLPGWAARVRPRSLTEAGASPSNMAGHARRGERGPITWQPPQTFAGERAEPGTPEAATNTVASTRGRRGLEATMEHHYVRSLPREQASANRGIPDLAVRFS